MSEVDFSIDGVLDDAREATGLSDFGDDRFREPLAKLLETYDRNRYTEKARRRNRRRVVTLLATRLRIEAAFRKHPEIRERRITRPMFLTGMPRSGTSALFNLLAMDPSARALLLWEAMNPDPVEGLELGQPDPRRQAIAAYYDGLRDKNPDFTKIHYASADTPEECVLLQAFSLDGAHLGVEPMLEPYASWFREHDFGPMYAYYRDCLKLLDWQRPGERWLLKTPAHMLALDALFANFPDASVVWNHRDPVAGVASICSMTAMLMDGREDLDKRELGPIVLEFYAGALDRGLATRERQDPKRFFDVAYGELLDDPLRIVRDLYRHFGIELPEEAQATMRAHVRENPKGQHGAHEYDPEEFGISRERVDERFAGYARRYAALIV